MNDNGPRPACIWVDADACPVPVREMLFRAAMRARVQLTLVANQWLRTPPSPFIRAIQVQGGYDVADDAIAERAGAGDLVVTQDIPLAARVLANGALAVNPRGERFTADNIAERLSVRNFMEELRGAGVQTGGPAAYGPRERQAFAAQLDRWIAQRRS
ncbi:MULTISPECIES: YaiI/YqxD family protein [Pseudoxanthomonas]|uniref:UPF0178 protein L613_004100000220 n=1 Tax=Pseudoxanthomonas taiwanensis J19 TaxID=935569 RepID=A0A562DHD2_9GAMM|nr:MULTISPECIES: YaiI/YqxD family protein [Pseudoxanthomonas]TWH09038.1 hypothetical protein L613_004100000220 [Pseudoxanthomonas taiwanensis J19]